MNDEVSRRQLLKGLTVLALGAGLLLTPGCDRLAGWLHPNRCRFCGRVVHDDMAVRVEVAGRAPEKACCLRCAISYAQQTGHRVRVLSVTDYVSHRPTRPDHAVYVVNSSVQPCAGPPVEVPASRRDASLLNWDRCLPSVIAFASRADAAEFQKQNGGTIETFDDLVHGTTIIATR